MMTARDGGRAGPFLLSTAALTLLLLASGITAVASLTLSIFSPRRYVSTAAFIPQQSESGTSGLALAASQFGIALPSSGGGWGPAVYVALLRSRAILEPLATDSFSVADGEWRQLSNLLSVDEPAADRRLAKTMRALNKVVTVREDAKLGAVRITVSTHWPRVSLALAERLVAEVNRFNIQTRRSQAGAERAFAETQAEEAELALRASEDLLQTFLKRNRSVDQSPELTFERERLQRTVEMRQQVYTTIVRSLEEARLREVRDTPVLTEIDTPKLALVGESRRVVIRTILGGFVGVVVGLAIIVMRYLRQQALETGVSSGRLLYRFIAQAFRDPRADAP